MQICLNPKITFNWVLGIIAEPFVSKVLLLIGYFACTADMRLGLHGLKFNFL